MHLSNECYSYQMDVARPWAPIRSRIDMEVVRVLCGITRPLTGRNVARLVRSGSQPAVNAALGRLAEEGIVEAQEAGNAFLYTLNREHLASPALEALADVRSELIRRMQSEVEAWKVQPQHVSIFGSAARGDGDTRSDIDIFVVRPPRVDSDDGAWRNQLDRLADRVNAWTGNRAAIAEVASADVRRLRRERPPVVEELLRDAITLAGPAPDRMLRPRA